MSIYSNSAGSMGKVVGHMGILLWPPSSVGWLYTQEWEDSYVQFWAASITWKGEGKVWPSGAQSQITRWLIYDVTNSSAHSWDQRMVSIQGKNSLIRSGFGHSNQIKACPLVCFQNLFLFWVIDPSRHLIFLQPCFILQFPRVCKKTYLVN